MKPAIPVLYTLLMFGAVSSCKKDAKEHPNEGTVLRMYTTTSVDSIVYYYLYERDPNNRVVSMRDSSKGSYESRANLTYGSNGKLEKVAFINNGHNTHNFEFEYNAAGLIAKRKWRSGSLVIGEHYDLYKYDAAGHLISDSSYTTTNNITYTLARVAKYIYTGENITEAEFYTSPNGTLQFESRIEYEYDNGINPLKDLEYQYYINVIGSSAYTTQVKSRNNILKSYIVDGNGNWTQLLNGTYQYNSSKYVWKATTKNITRSLPATVTEYFYQ